MLPREFLTKIMLSGAIWGVPKYVITNLKINNCKGKNQQENLIALFLSLSNIAEHVSW